MTESRIPFNRPYMTGNEFGYIGEANAGFVLAGTGRLPNAATAGSKSRRALPRRF